MHLGTSRRFGALAVMVAASLALAACEDGLKSGAPQSANVADGGAIGVPASTSDEAADTPASTPQSANPVPAPAPTPHANPTQPNAPQSTQTPTPAHQAGSADPLTALYPADFTLTALSADPIADVAKPERATGPDSGLVDPTYGTRIYRATSADEGEGGRMRHEYSRRQAFNADNSRYLAQDTAGHWHLYDGATFAHLTVLQGLAGDCEPLWHPSDPNTLYFTSINGGRIWWSYNVNTGEKTELFDFTGKTPWPQATSFWTKGEGALSADGRYLALMATAYNEQTQKNTIYGLLTLDLQKKEIIGTLDAEKFPVPHAFPDHISTSPSGAYAVPSWLKEHGGTWAYSRDFSQSWKLAEGSEHSDLAYGPNREDYLVYADYSRGAIVAINVETREVTDLHTLYPASGEAYAVHISGQAFDRPGWVVISTYADSADYGKASPSPTVRPEYRKVWLQELAPEGRALNIAHIRANEHDVQGDPYFLEPQASASRDLSRIIFASNFGGGPVESYVVALPNSVFKD
ncbi:hypothetical protein [Schaalia canis]|uniref:hypothetical protein n=1 Tax=Schaalia canis TaxID=100469 RepID=UPI001F0C3DC5|nr:hypothetical protein [Schaalia canis]